MLLPPPAGPLPLLPPPVAAASATSMVTVKTEWERDESWFISVAPVDRFFLPTCTHNVGREEARWSGAGRQRARVVVQSPTLSGLPARCTLRLARRRPAAQPPPHLQDHGDLGAALHHKGGETLDVHAAVATLVQLQPVLGVLGGWDGQQGRRCRWGAWHRRSPVGQSGICWELGSLPPAPHPPPRPCQPRPAPALDSRSRISSL